MQGSHQTLDALFVSSGAPGEPPDLAHHSKWKEWLFRAGQDPKVDSLAVLGNILEEFMDVPPVDPDLKTEWEQRKRRVEDALSTNGLQYFQGGRVIPNGAADQSEGSVLGTDEDIGKEPKVTPSSIDELISVVVHGLPRAMFPLSHRRKGATELRFDREYDIQDLLHSLLRPWISDIRAEEYTPSYAGSNTRMDFLLPKYEAVIETKFVRDRSHAKKIGDELIIDIGHYRSHPSCRILWCIIYDPDKLIPNAGGLESDLKGEHSNSGGSVSVRVIIV